MSERNGHASRSQGLECLVPSLSSGGFQAPTPWHHTDPLRSKFKLMLASDLLHCSEGLIASWPQTMVNMKEDWIVAQPLKGPSQHSVTVGSPGKGDTERTIMPSEFSSQGNDPEVSSDRRGSEQVVESLHSNGRRSPPY